MNRLMHAVWGAGLVAAALVLGNKAEEPLPWAVGLLGLIVLAGTGLAALVEANQRDAERG